MSEPKPGRSAACRTVLSLSIVALVVFLETAFQTAQILHDRDALDRIRSEQEAPFGEVVHQQTNFEALVRGTLNLARDGDGNVLPVIEQMKRQGVLKETPNP